MKPPNRVVAALLWFLVAFAALGIVACLTQAVFGGAVFYVIVGAASGYGLLRQRRRRKAIADAAIIARADYEHQQYLSGNPTGTYGQYQPPTS